MIQVFEQDRILHLVTELLILQAAKLDEWADAVPVFLVVFSLGLAHTGQLVCNLLGNLICNLIHESIILQRTSGYVQRQIRAVDNTL